MDVSKAISLVLWTVTLVPATALAQPTDELIPPVDSRAITDSVVPLHPAQPVGSPLSLADLEQMAMANNPTLAEAAARVDAARGRWVQGGLRPNPTVGYQGNEIGNEGEAGQQGAFVGQEFVRGGKLGLNQQVAQREIIQAERQLEAQRMRILNDVRIEFYSVVVAQRTLELSRRLVEVGNRGLDITNALLKAQEVSQVELLQARIEFNSARIAVQNAQNRYEASWRRLATFVGAPTLAPTPLAGDAEQGLQELTWDESLVRLLSASPEIAVARAGVERACWALRRAQAEPIPNLDLQAAVQYDSATEDTVTSVQVGMPLPVHNRNQGNIREAQANLRAAEAEVLRVQLALQQRLAVAFERYATARQQALSYSEDILPDAQKSLDLVTAGYQQGEFNFLTVLTAQRTYFQTNLAYLTALNDLWASTVAIEGLLLTDSLETRPR